MSHWEPRINALRSSERRKSDLDRKHHAFALLTVLELAYAAADIFPVEVRPNASEPALGLHGLTSASRFDEEARRIV